MDHLAHFRKETTAFAAAARSAGAALVRTCPGWAVADLVRHLGGVHRHVAHLIANRLTEPPASPGPAVLALPADTTGWPRPGHTPTTGPLPDGMVTWFAEGAAALAEEFASAGPGTRVWTWSQDQSVGFWIRMQAIEAAVHRWDAEDAAAPATARPVDGSLAADAIGQTFEVMAPLRRAMAQAPPGAGETYAFRRDDGPGTWTVRFDGDDVRLTEGPADVELTGTASDLMLWLWQRVSADRLAVRGDRALLDRYFTLVPPL
ncbi:maleylpyruvate isomerase family mycothiol-dependent enzyme [Nonomuraea sp. NPDC049725]|uniref:maleylpyruvate isomerase family mycothiol-dependent enzyme n=1 Tax=Nonomuraea sp. NPDC049725 TaxID=3154508 RepID=UPI003440ABFF